MSVEWSRIEPEPGDFDHAAIDRYRAMLDGLRQRGIRPMVTLHHFTNPLWLERTGGWENPEVVTRFQNYVRYTVHALGDLCDLWITINEPLVYLAQGWFRGIWPPQKVNPLGTVRVFRHMLLAHGVAYQTIHTCAPDAQVGYAKAVRVFRRRTRRAGSIAKPPISSATWSSISGSWPRSTASCARRWA